MHAIQYQDEDRISLPDCFIRLPDIARTVYDVKKFKK